MNLRRMISGWSEPGPTAVTEHGANPGLVSYFTRHALPDIAQHALADKKLGEDTSETIAHHAAAQNFNHLARLQRLRARQNRACEPVIPNPA